MSRQTDLIRVVQRLSLCRDLDAVTATLREAARDLTSADGVTVVLRDGDLCHYAEENAIAPLWKGRRFPMSTCISGWCMLHRQQVVITDIYADSRIPHDAYRPTFVKSLAMTPIRSENPLGAIGAYWASHHRATNEELQILQALGDSASVALDNIQLIERLSDANRRKDEFLSILAHELRNPLAPIMTGLHLMNMADRDDEQRRRAHDMMQRQVRHMAHLVDDLLDVARLTRGQITLRRERLDFARLVSQCAEDHRRLFDRARTPLTVQVPHTPVWVNGDSTRLSQVVVNLLDNAAKFTPPGGEVNVRLTSDARTGEALLTVTDTGIGIDAAVLPTLFQTFAQADASLDRSRGGLGLGLAVARGLLELHSGHIEARSSGSGTGSVFTVRLPLAGEPAALRDRRTTPSRISRSVRVLVVEDNRDAAESVQMLLEAHGYEVFVAFTGPDGVEAARAHRPNVVLCDIGLPGLDGFEVAGKLRSDPATARITLIAVTGYGQDADRQRSAAAGFDLHLVKPVDPGRLLNELALAPAG
jgi:signal transduction histidine kinase